MVKKYDKITKASTFMVSEQGQIILVEDITGDYLRGTNMNGVLNPVGFYCKQFSKDLFVPWYGEITIKAPQDTKEAENPSHNIERGEIFALVDGLESYPYQSDIDRTFVGDVIKLIKQKLHPVS